MSGFSALARTLILLGFFYYAIDMDRELFKELESNLKEARLLLIANVIVTAKTRLVVKSNESDSKPRERTKDGYLRCDPTPEMIEAYRASQKRWMVFWGCVVFLGVLTVIFS